MSKSSGAYAPVKTAAQPLLKFGRGNSKLDAAIFTFSIPAGYTCPFASACLSKADRVTGKLTDGKKTEFRCFSASEENYRKAVRHSRWRNLELLSKARTAERMTRLIESSLSPFASLVRVHVSGDYYNQAYFDSWLSVAMRRRRTTFYGYTKALPLWVNRLDLMPENFILTASYGGTHDHLIEEFGLRYAKVVFSPEEAEGLGLELDHDDSHAIANGPSFALLLHGMQPPNSKAIAALMSLRKRGEFGYGDAARRKKVEYLESIA